MKLSDHINLGNKATRDGFGEGFYHLGKTNDKVVGLTADLMGSMKMDAFAKDWPDRFVQVGIAEANMMGVAAVLADRARHPGPAGAAGLGRQGHRAAGA